jgi:hypothetical protein
MGVSMALYGSALGFWGDLKTTLPTTAFLNITNLGGGGGIPVQFVFNFTNKGHGKCYWFLTSISTFLCAKSCLLGILGNECPHCLVQRVIGRCLETATLGVHWGAKTHQWNKVRNHNHATTHASH